MRRKIERRVGVLMRTREVLSPIDKADGFSGFGAENNLSDVGFELNDYLGLYA